MVPILFLCSLLAVAALSLWLFSPLVNTILFSSETINSTSKQLLENNQGPWEGKWKTNYVRLALRLPLLQMISKIEDELNRWIQINHQKKSTGNFTQHHISQGILLFYWMILTVPSKKVKSQKRAIRLFYSFSVTNFHNMFCQSKFFIHSNYNFSQFSVKFEAVSP